MFLVESVKKYNWIWIKESQITAKCANPCGSGTLLLDLASLHSCLGLRLAEMADPQRTNGSNKHQLCSVAVTGNGGLAKNKRKQQTPTLYCSVVVSGNSGPSVKQTEVTNTNSIILYSCFKIRNRIV
jgi:hypothetical protein